MSILVAILGVLCHVVLAFVIGFAIPLGLCCLDWALFPKPPIDSSGFQGMAIVGVSIGCGALAAVSIFIYELCQYL